jgi:hypothetical protein
MPPICGAMLPGRMILMINSVDFLQDIYVRYNDLNTKFAPDMNCFLFLSRSNVVVMNTFDKDYHATRKELSAAFFKSKLQTITRIIKEEVIDVI